MAWIRIESTAAGAPELKPVNGSLNQVLRWALPQLGWEIEFGSTGNSTIFRAATGNRHRLQVRHESSLTNGDTSIACVRAGHTSTGASNLGSPFPTAGQVPNANSTWQAGDSGSPDVPVRWVIYGNGVFFHYFAYTPQGWEWSCFGDVPSDYATGYETVILVRNYPYGGHPAGMAAPSYAHPQGNNVEYWARGINGSTVSTFGNRQSSAHGSALGRVSQAPVMRGGYQNRILREKVALACTGSANTTLGVLAIPNRGWLPNVWNPIHSGDGGVGADDTFTDSAYNPAASFRIFSAASFGTLIMEETDTWSKP